MAVEFNRVIVVGINFTVVNCLPVLGVLRTFHTLSPLWNFSEGKCRMESLVLA